MAVVIPNVGALTLLAQAFSVWSPWYHLYVNQPDLGPDTVVGDFQEPAGGWYGVLQAWHWTDPIIFGPVAVTYSDPLVWTAGSSRAAESVYGYYVTLGVNGPLAWAELRDAGPVDMSESGNQVQVVPRFTFRQDPLAQSQPRQHLSDEDERSKREKPQR